MTKFVYLFREADGKDKAKFGGKGANLAEMTKLGMPVPPGFQLLLKLVPPTTRMVKKSIVKLMKRFSKLWQFLKKKLTRNLDPLKTRF